MLDNQDFNQMTTNTNIDHTESNKIPDKKRNHLQEDHSTKTSIWQRYRTQNQNEKPIERVSLQNLFRYASFADSFYILLAIITSAVLGIANPLFLIVFGNSIDSFTDRETNLCSFNFTSLTQEYCPPGVMLTSTNFYASISLCNFTGSNYTNIYSILTNQTNTQLIFLIIISCSVLISAYIRMTFFNITAERQTRIIRQTLFQSILKKDIVYFDTHKTGELNSILTDDVNKIRDGIGDKLGPLIETISTLVSGVIIGIVKGWKLALVTLSTLPVILASLYITSKVITSLTAIELKAYGKAGAIAEEAISSIRTVLSYNGQEKEIQRYEQSLDDAKKNGIKKNIINGVTMGIQLFLMYSLDALASWYGAKLIHNENYTIGRVYTVNMKE